MNHDKNNRTKESEAVIRPYSHIDLSYLVHSKIFIERAILIEILIEYGNEFMLN